MSRVDCISRRRLLRGLLLTPSGLLLPASAATVVQRQSEPLGYALTVAQVAGLRTAGDLLAPWWVRTCWLSSRSPNHPSDAETRDVARRVRLLLGPLSAKAQNLGVAITRELRCDGHPTFAAIKQQVQTESGDPVDLLDVQRDVRQLIGEYLVESFADALKVDLEEYSGDSFLRWMSTIGESRR